MIRKIKRNAGDPIFHNGKLVGVEPESTEPGKKIVKPKIKKTKEPITGEIVDMTKIMAYQTVDNKKHVIGSDLFGGDVLSDPILRDKFIEPPFSVLDTRGANWKQRTRLWKSKGIRSEVGRSAKAFNTQEWLRDKTKSVTGHQGTHDTSIFDPTLCELMYHWFCPVGGKILDPFAGGSVRGIVASYLGYFYTGIDIRREQVESNREQTKEILGIVNKKIKPIWYIGDSNIIDSITEIRSDFDFLFSCPPYGDLEIYSDLPGDISNKPYPEFLKLYRSIIKKSCDKLKTGSYAAWVVGEIRNRKGYYVGFVPDTIAAFIDAGMKFYNDAILMNHISQAAMRADGNMKYQKLVKCHQNVLVFKKP